jgi:hypothetical protein
MRQTYCLFCLFLSLILATKYHPLPILERVIDYISSNRYFVIYSQIQEVKAKHIFSTLNISNTI